VEGEMPIIWKIALIIVGVLLILGGAILLWGAIYSYRALKKYLADNPIMSGYDGPWNGIGYKSPPKCLLQGVLGLVMIYIGIIVINF
jgi:hypothetical protein